MRMPRWRRAMGPAIIRLAASGETPLAEAGTKRKRRLRALAHTVCSGMGIDLPSADDEHSTRDAGADDFAGLLSSISRLADVVAHANDAGWWGAGPKRRALSISALRVACLAAATASLVLRARICRKRSVATILMRMLAKPPARWAAA